MMKGNFLSALELKVPPVALLLIAAGTMWLISLTGPMWLMPLVPRVVIALILVATGVAIIAAAVASFQRASTTISPLNPDAASSLVCTGIYRFTRNPMYLGFLLMLLGWAAYLSSVRAIIVALVFVLYMNRFQIIPEERALAVRFGGQFRDYMQNVRRWL